MRTLADALRVAIGTLARNPTRAALTVLGILVGIAAVVIVTALAQSTSAAVIEKIDSMSSNAIYVWPRPIQASGPRSKFVGRLTDADARAIVHEASAVRDAAPFLITQAQIVYADRNISTWVVGTTLAYYRIRRFAISKGENWTETDEIAKTKVCVIGQTVATKLFGTEDPIGRTVRIGHSPYRVIGLLAQRGSGASGEDQDDRIMMPAASYRARVVRTPPGRADELMLSAASPETVGHAVDQVKSILRQRHHLEPGRDDFEVRTQVEMRQRSASILDTLSLLGISVAAVSLLVGGVGVMNIMFVSVVERTREIGIRMSIGARERDILVQFLVEAIVLTLCGGILGIACGSVGAIGIGWMFAMSIAPSGSAIGFALATSTAIGVVFGLMPAWRAAKLDPIAALRSE